MKKITTTMVCFLLTLIGNAQIKSTDLILHHDFNNNLIDGANNNDIALSGTAAFTVGTNSEANGALTFPADADYATLGNAVTLGTDYTISVWFKLTEDRYSQSIISNYVFCQPANTGVGIWYYGTAAQANPRLRFQVGSVSYEHPGDLVDSQWHHAVLVLNNGDFDAYIDNVKVGTRTSTYASTTSDLFVGYAEKTAPGCGNFNSTNNTGAVDELRIYSVALTDAEIESIYNNESEFILSSSFTGNANDESGNDYHGTAANGAALTTGITGDNDGAYTFAGADDAINFGDTIDFGTEFTTSVWFKLTEDRYVQNIISNYIHCQSSNSGYGIWYYGTDAGTKRLRFQLGSNNYEHNVDLIDSKWHHAVMTVGASGFKAYIDGVEVGTGTGSYTATSANLYVGYAEKTVATCGFNNSTNNTGSIDNLKIYRDSLSTSQVEAIFNNISVITSSKEISNSSNLVLYPNPATNEIHLTGVNTVGTYKVYSSIGVAVQSGVFNKETIELNQLSTGTYLLVLDQEAAQPLVKLFSVK